MDKKHISVLDGSNEDAVKRLEELLKEHEAEEKENTIGYMDKKYNYMYMLDGSPEEEDKAVAELLSTLTEEEHNRAMSSEFDYLDED